MNPSAMQETSVQSLGREDPLKRGKATHCSVLVWRIPWTVHGVAKSRTGLSTFHFHSGSPSQNRITRGPEPLLKGLAQQVDSAVILTRHKLLVQLITEELNFCSLIKGVLLSPRKQKVWDQHRKIPRCSGKWQRKCKNPKHEKVKTLNSGDCFRWRQSEWCNRTLLFSPRAIRSLTGGPTEPDARTPPQTHRLKVSEGGWDPALGAV